MPFDEKVTPAAPGLQIVIPGKIVVVPELNLGQREDNEDLIREAIRGAPAIPGQTPEEREQQLTEAGQKIKKVICMALSRNYPKVVEADLREFGMDDINAALGHAVFGKNYEKLRAEAEAALAKKAAAKVGEDVAVPAGLNGTAATIPTAA